MSPHNPKETCLQASSKGQCDLFLIIDVLSSKVVSWYMTVLLQNTSISFKAFLFKIFSIINQEMLNFQQKFSSLKLH